MYPFQFHFYIIVFAVVLVPISIHFQTYILIIIFICWLVYLYVYRGLKISIILASICTIGIAYMYLPTIEHKETIEKENVTIQGEIITKIEETDKTIYFTVEVEDEKIYTTYFKENDTSPHMIAQLQYGAICQFEGELGAPKQATNPYEFDFSTYLAKQGIYKQLLVSSTEHFHCETSSSFLQKLYEFRKNIMTKIETNFSDVTSAWMKALLFGNTAQIDEEIIDTFQRWGLSHILAISGLHVGIITALLYFVFVSMRITTKENAALLIICFLPMYIFLAGAEPSVWRASLMVIVILVMQRFSINIFYADLLSMIMLLLIIFHPYIIYHIGFQFSFAVTFSLIISSQLLKHTKIRWVQALQISFIAQMAILPLQIHYFSIFQPLSIIINVIVIPYFTLFVMPLLFIQLISIFLPNVITSFIDTLFRFMHEKALNLIASLDTFGQFPLFIGNMNMFTVILYYSFFVIFLICLERKTWKKSVVSGLLFCSFLILLALRPYYNPYGTVTMLNMGQGDAFVIELPFRKGVYMIDAGAKFSFENMEPTNSVYKNVIRPFLYGKGIQKIDAIFISHEDLDHDGSVPFIMNQFHVEKIIVSEYFEIENSSVLRESDKIKRIKTGTTLEENGMKWHIIGPFIDKDDANENSLNIVVTFGSTSWLFTGDMYVENEAILIEQYPNLQIDVLKIAHHGSKTSTSDAMLHHIQPTVALIPVGENNRYNHPSTEVIDRLEEHHIKIYRTDKDGAVEFHYKEDHAYFRAFKQTK